MKKKIYSILLVGILSLTGTIADANGCSNTYKKCKSPDKSYTLSTSSRSIKMRRGRKVAIMLNVFGGKEYFFSTYSKPKMGVLQFKIISPINNKILYDNSAEGLCDTKVFKVDNTQKLLIEISAPNWQSSNTYECAGFKIAYK
ncbi:hypothetical protein SAMN06265379_101349 [Saccharicrinis carchari]|uniref:Uncharacterized protein n=1 Tax=Saccharicrinis carchari TaxID=1168039 RepID=A0A521ASF7_SACCC|nr:hypothetical protein [Saccharicrinis carchari]SMO37580.1 hypothetical protein SAMN06265379_101349 [Saccharicrinis carchari]